VSSAARARGVAGLCLVALACTGPRRAAAPAPTRAPADGGAGTAIGAPPAAARVEVEEPEAVVVGREDLELAAKNDEELLAIGQAAYAAGDFARAANAFARIADLFPGSRHHATALFDAGLAAQRLGDWRLALERFRRFQAEYAGPDAIEAGFREAECHYHLGALGEARAVLDRLAARADAGPDLRVRALARRGVVEYEAKDLVSAERSLTLAVAEHAEGEKRERLDPYDAAQARFYLGEVYRAHFDARPLDPATGDAALSRALEEKSQLLLAAQGHYLKAIKLGHAGWAVAAGERIGALYDALHAALVGAPEPPGLAAEDRGAYRTELRRRTRVLVAKSISAYEQTLAAAQRAGVENRYVAQAKASLERMRQELADPAEGDAPP
jgi:tetratricopeptide (TPR) repeat protein